MARTRNINIGKVASDETGRLGVISKVTKNEAKTAPLYLGEGFDGKKWSSNVLHVVADSIEAHLRAEANDARVCKAAPAAAVPETAV
jgi:hypothetical protein